MVYFEYTLSDYGAIARLEHTAQSGGYKGNIWCILSRLYRVVLAVCVCALLEYEVP